jgi:uncharacterized delta-60 repeat protein
MKANRNFDPGWKCGLALLAALSIGLLLVEPVSAASGDLDPSFGSEGRVLVDFFGNTNAALSVAVLPDDRIVATGLIDPPDGGVMAVRLDPEGALDPTFDDDGRRVTFAALFETIIARDGLVQPDGRVVTAGSYKPPDNPNPYFFLHRYLASGGIDTGFGVGGRVITLTAPGEVTALAIQPDGSLVAAGTSLGDFAVVRYLANGMLDATFGSGGMVVTDFAGSLGADYVNDVVIQSDGKIVVAGATDPDPAHEGRFMALARYLPDGTLDAGFGMGGRVITPVGVEAEANAIAIQPDGGIIAAGYSETDFLVARYGTDGLLDACFGQGGIATADLGALDRAGDVAVQADGRIVAAGLSSPRIGMNDFVLARFERSGNPDPSFGSAGKVLTEFSANGSAPAIAAAVAIQPDGRIVAAGSVRIGTNTDFAIARYLSGPKDTASWFADLASRLDCFDLVEGLSSALHGKLDGARADFEAGDPDGACGEMGAFLHQVEAQSGKKFLTTEQADALIESATAVAASLGC